MKLSKSTYSWRLKNLQRMHTYSNLKVHVYMHTANYSKRCHKPTCCRLICDHGKNLHLLKFPLELWLQAFWMIDLCLKCSVKKPYHHLFVWVFALYAPTVQLRCNFTLASSVTSRVRVFNSRACYWAIEKQCSQVNQRSISGYDNQRLSVILCLLS